MGTIQASMMVFYFIFMKICIQMDNNLGTNAPMETSKFWNLEMKMTNTCIVILRNFIFKSHKIWNEKVIDQFSSILSSYFNSRKQSFIEVNLCYSNLDVTVGQRYVQIFF